MDSMQKRDRDRKRRQKQQEKDARRKERAEQKLLRRTNPELGTTGTDQPEILDSSLNLNEPPAREPAL